MILKLFLDNMNEFLKELSKEQLVHLQYILNNEIEGDIDFFLFKIEEELRNKKDTKSKYCCSVCEGTNIQLQAWIDPNNNNRYIEDTEDDECWCDDCKEH